MCLVNVRQREERREKQNPGFVKLELLKTANVTKAEITFSLLLPSSQLTCLDLTHINLRLTHAKSFAVTLPRLISHHPFMPVQEVERKLPGDFLQCHRTVLGNKDFSNTDLI